MVKINSDGQVVQNSWSVSGFLSNVVDVVFLFFRTLVGFESSSSTASSASSGYSGIRTLGGTSNFGSRNGPGGATRRIGRINTLRTMAVPMGGCAGGSCG